MVSFEHEVLLSLFQTRPLLAAEVLRLLGVAVPPCSVLAHGKEPEGARIALSALKAVATLASDSQMLYSDVILGAVGAAAKVALEEQMDIRKYEFKSDFAKKHQAKGREEGLAEGARSARVAALLAILDARGLAVSAAEEDTIRACTDDAALTRWIRKAATAATVTEVFAEG